MKISATIQARMGSSRLPGKVLKPILGKPMLALQIERIQRSMLIDEIIIATPEGKENDPIEQLASELDVYCFRGSEDDVLGRVVGALKAYNVDLHIEFSGDNPMPDFLLVDAFLGYYLKYADKYDYVTNVLKTTYPPGAEIHIYPATVLIDAESRATDRAMREHVAPHIYHKPDRYRLCNLEAPPCFHYPEFYLEVDTQDDFDVISAIYEHFYPENPCFNLKQIIDYLKVHPELAARNTQVERRWKALLVK